MSKLSWIEAQIKRRRLTEVFEDSDIILSGHKWPMR